MSAVAHILFDAAGQQDALVINAGITPDGATILILGHGRNPDGTEDRRPRLYSRRLDSYDVKPIPGTDDVTSLTVSPDGRSLAFISRVSEQSDQRRIAKVPIDGSAPPVVLADWNDSWNAAFVWLEDGDLLIPMRAGEEASFFRLPTGGGAPKPPMKLDTGRRTSWNSTSPWPCGSSYWPKTSSA